MSQVSVFVEEHLIRELKFDIPDDNADARMVKAEALAREKIDNGEVTLTADDYSGIRLLMVKDEETAFETNWVDY